MLIYVDRMSMAGGTTYTNRPSSDGVVLIGIATVYLAISSNATESDELPEASEIELARRTVRSARVTPAAKKEAFDAVTRGAWNFTVNLYKNMANRTDESFVTAPLSLSVALAMATYGAEKDTKANLLGLLGLSDAPPDTVVIGYQQLIDRVMDDENSTLRVANTVSLMTDGIRPMDNYLRRIKKGVRAKQRRLEPHHNEHSPMRIMERWIGAQRKDVTMDIVSLSEITFDPMFVLASAFYIGGGWKKHFDDLRTEMRYFWYKGTIDSLIPTMYTRRVCRHGELPEVKARFVELPYESNSTKNALSMFIILPNEKDGLAYVEENLEKLRLDKLFVNNFEILDLYLPKFKIENYLCLEEILQTMGLTDVFTGAANFDNIDDQEHSVVRGLGHAALVDVSSTGTNLGLSLSRMVPPIYYEEPEEELFRIIGNVHMKFAAAHPFIALVITQGDNPVTLLTARFTGH